MSLNSLYMSVVIIGLNEEKLVGRCLDAFVSQKYQGKYEIIFVDSASKDATLSIVKTYCDRLPLRVISQKTRGIGDAREIGFQLAHGEIVVSTDADSFVPVHWLSAIDNFFHTHPHAVGCVGPYVFDSYRKVKNSIWYGICVIGDYFIKIVTGTFYFRGLNFAIRRSVWKQCGGFDRSISALEDVDLAARASKYGRIGYLSNVFVTTTNRRFRDKKLSRFLYRLNAFIYRVVFRDNSKYTEWEQVR